MSNWIIRLENGREYHYEGSYCGAVNYAESCTMGLGYSYTIEEEEE